MSRAFAPESVHSLSFLTYNIDGLNPVNLNYRTNTALALIVSANADVVQLQEVVSDTAPIIIKTLVGHGYSNFSETSGFEGYCHYFTLTFAKVRKFSSCSVRRVPYTGSASSQQGRDSLQLSLVYMGVPWLFVNCHLESCGVAFKSTGSTIRQAQLTHGLRLVAEHAVRGPAVLAGDLNIRDPEASAVRKLFGTEISDASEVCMVDKKKSATWYMPAPSTYSARYDRVYCNNAHGLVAKTFTIIGGEDIYADLADGGGFHGEALPYRTPSDHRGLVVVFQFAAPANAPPRSVGGYGMSSGVPVGSAVSAAGVVGRTSEGTAVNSSSSGGGDVHRQGRAAAPVALAGGKRKLPVPHDAEVICLSSDDDGDRPAANKKVLKRAASPSTGSVARPSAGPAVSEQRVSASNGGAAGQGQQSRDGAEEQGVDAAEAKRRRRELQLQAAERRAGGTSSNT